MAEWISVEVVYARPERQLIIETRVPVNATIAEAIERSGICAEFPDLDLKTAKVGIFSHRCPLDTVVTAGDRVEIYRPLLIDPKELRRQRAARKSR